MKTTLTWYNCLQYIAMLVAVAMIPIDWNTGLVSLWALMALVLASAIKMVCDRKVGNPSLSRSARVGIGLIVAWVAIYAIGVLFSNDVNEALSVLQIKVVILVFPLVVLLTNTSYLTPRMQRWLLGSVVVGVLLRILGCAVWAGWRMAHGDATLASVLGCEGFDARHHAYSALYAVPAIALLLLNLAGFHFTTESHKPEGNKVLSWIALVVIVWYVIDIDSRAGVLAMYAVSAVVVGYQLVQRQWLRGIATGVLLLLLFWGVPQLQNRSSRIVDTIEEVASDQGETRLKVNAASYETFLQHPWLGYSPGDYRVALHNTFERRSHEYALEHDLNCHNQYFETVLAVGIQGLLFLLLMLAWPLWIAIRNRSYLLLVLLWVMVLSANLLFESMLERQMGLQFFGCLYALMYLILSQKENKFGGLQK